MSADVSTLEDAVRLHAEALLLAASEYLVESMKDDVPVVSGDLLQSIGADPPQMSGEEATVEIYATSAHAVFVDRGRGEVMPVVARVLRWNGVGGVVFSMRSGPVPANPFFSERMPDRVPTALQNAAFAVVTVAA